MTEHDATATAAPPPPAWEAAYGHDYLTEAQVAKLLEGIHPGRVAVLDGLSHLEAYDVRAHLTRVFGFGRWSERLVDHRLLYALETQTKNGKEAVKVAYEATVRLSVFTPRGSLLAEFDGAAVGESIMPEFKRGDAFDMALKTSMSQALKRAVIDLGDQFGLSLYRKGSKDALVRHLFSGMPDGGVAAAGPVPAEPDVVPGDRPVDAIDPAELGVDTATGEVPAGNPRPASAQRAQAPSPQAAARVASSVAKAADDAGVATDTATGEVAAPAVGHDLTDLWRRIRLDQMEAWLAEHHLDGRTPPGQEGEEYTLGQLLQGRRDALRDAGKAARAVTPAVPAQAAGGALSPAGGIPHADGHTPSETWDPDGEVKEGAPRRGVLQSLHGMGVTDTQIADYFGRPVERVATKKLTGLVRHVIGLRNGVSA